MRVLQPCPHCGQILYVTSASAHKCPEMPRRCYRCRYWQRIYASASPGGCYASRPRMVTDELDTCPKWETR